MDKRENREERKGVRSEQESEGGMEQRGTGKV